MKAREGKGGWVVCERQAVSENQDKIFYVSRRFGTEEEAERKRDRMRALPEYSGHALDVTFRADEPRGKRRLPNNNRRPRR
jgi:hypothetical protein